MQRLMSVARMRRCISNVCSTGVEGKEMAMTAPYLVYSFLTRQGDPDVGRYLEMLGRSDGAVKSRYQREGLDLDVLSRHGVVSIC